MNVRIRRLKLFICLVSGINGHHSTEVPAKGLASKMKVDFILKLSKNVPFLYVSWLMFTAESLIKKHSVHPAGSDSLFTYTTGNKTMNDTEIIIDTPGLMKKRTRSIREIRYN